MHWLHSVEQMVFHIGSTCHTTDEYYRVLCELLEDRQFAILSAMSESKRSESVAVLAVESLNDSNESKVNKLRAEANLSQNESRSIIARPALSAALFEVWAIQTLISEISPYRNFSLPDPISHQTAQYFESILDLAWRAFVELKTYQALSLDIQGQLLARDIDFDFSQVNTRDDVYRMVCAKLRWFNIKHFMVPSRMQSLWETVKSHMEACPQMQAYLSDHSLCKEGLTNEICRTFAKSAAHQIPNK